MEMLLSGPDWKFMHFLPYQALGEKVFAPEYDWSVWPNATVPGNAQLDLLRNGTIEDPYLDFASRDAEWVSARQWVYAKKFTLGRELDGKRIILRFDGIDYAGTIYFNHERLGSHENLFIPVEFEVTDKVKLDEDNVVMVILDPAPDEFAQFAWTSRVKTFKPRINYGWDFAARCIPVGIWKDVKLSVSGGVRITDCWSHATLCEDLTRGTVNLTTTLDSDSPRTVTVESHVLFGDETMESNSTQLDLQPGEARAAQVLAVADPKLWWPNGSGPQNRYVAHVAIKNAQTGEVLDERGITFGFKRVRLLPNIGIPEGLKPWNFEVNGVRTFIKGWNWVPIDELYGGRYVEKMERMIRLAAEANVNLLRVWGGGIIEKEHFYELCDRHGIMVWQEFTLTGSGEDNTPSTDPKFLEELGHLAESVVPLRRNYACHTVWCCGNELTWTGEEDPAMRTVHEVVDRLDPDNIYVPTSPLWTGRPGEPAEIDIHGQWWYQGVTDHYTMYNERRPAFHSEFGVEGAANFENTERFIKNAKIWPASAKNPIYRHRGKDWIRDGMMRSIFGEIEDARQYFRLSQFLQWEGLRYIVESGRRRKYACGGTIPWQFNEPWPNLSCTNCVDYYAEPKMAYYAVAKAYAPVHVSACYDSLSVSSGQTFAADLYANNSGAAIAGCALEWSIRDLQGTVLAEGAQSVTLPENSASQIGTARFVVPAEFAAIFVLFLKLSDSAGNLLSKNAYFFSSAPEPILEGMKALPESQLKVLGSSLTPSDNGSNLLIEIANAGECMAMFVRATPQDTSGAVFFRNNYLVLPPGERGAIDAIVTKPISNFTIEGWNTSSETVP